MSTGSIPSSNSHAMPKASQASGASSNTSVVIAPDGVSPPTSYSASSNAPFGDLPQKIPDSTQGAAASGFSAGPLDAKTLRKGALALPIFHTGIGIGFRNLFHCIPKESAEEAHFKSELDRFAERYVECFNQQPPDLDAALRVFPTEFANLTRAHGDDIQRQTEQVRTLVTVLIDKGKIKPRGQAAAAEFMARLVRHADLKNRFPCHVPELVLDGGLQEAFRTGGWQAVEPALEEHPPGTKEWNATFDAVAGILPELFRGKEMSKELYLQMRDGLADLHRQLCPVQDAGREEQDLECAQLLCTRNPRPAHLPSLSDLIQHLPTAKDAVGWHAFVKGNGGVLQTIQQFWAEDVSAGTAIVRKDLPDGSMAFDVFKDGRLITDPQARRVALDSILKPDPAGNAAPAGTGGR